MSGRITQSIPARFVMTSDRFVAGDVVWAPDPYRTGSNPRPWLVLSADAIPYSGEEYICVGLTLSDLPANIAVTESDWVAGYNPERLSYCSPWVLATIKHDAIASPQGRVTDEFTQGIVDRSSAYLSGDIDS